MGTYLPPVQLLTSLGCYQHVLHLGQEYALPVKKKRKKKKKKKVQYHCTILKGSSSFRPLANRYAPSGSLCP